MLTTIIEVASILAVGLATLKIVNRFRYGALALLFWPIPILLVGMMCGNL